MVVCSRNMASLTKSWIILTLPISVFFISENYLEFFRLAIFLRTTKTGIFSLFRSGSFRNESLRALYRQNTNGTIQNGDLGLEGGILEG